MATAPAAAVPASGSGTALKAPAEQVHGGSKSWVGVFLVAADVAAESVVLSIAAEAAADTNIYPYVFI